MVVELIVLVGCVAVGAVLVVALSSDITGERALEMLPFDVGAVAATLLVAAAWTGQSRRVRLVACAVAAYAAAPLLLRGAGLDPVEPFWLLAGGVAALGAVGLLALALRARAPRHDRAPRLLVAVVALVVAVVVVLRFAAPAAVPPGWLVVAVGMLAWSGAGAMSLLMITIGVQTGRPLLRRVGLAFVALAAARAIALLGGAPAGTAQGPAAQTLELGAMGMLLVAGAMALRGAIRTVRGRLSEADAVLASAAAREEELRAVVAVLPGRAGMELQRVLDGERVPAQGGDPESALVGPLLRDLAVLHRSSGLAVELDVEPGLRVGVDHWALGQAVNHLLVNCERHAPGARVCLRARRDGLRARLEVVDDGPGVPADVTSEILRRGNGGLAVTADIVGRYGGTFTLTSHDSGTVATIDLPLRDTSQRRASSRGEARQQRVDR